MSNQRCRWRCPAGHEWIAPVAARTRGYGCPECGAAKVAAQWVLPRPGRSFAELHPEESRQFVRNLTRPGIGPTKLRPRSIDRCIWRCERCENEWEATPDKRASGRGCPICAQLSRATARATAPPQKSLAVMNPELAREFVENITRPGHGPDLVGPGSNMRCRWRCQQCQKIYLATVQARVRGNGCPDCGRRRAATSRATADPSRSLRALLPNIADQYVENLDRPDQTPDELNPGSHARCRWQCPDCGETWVAAVASRTAGRGCPHCGRTRLRAAWRRPRPGESLADSAPSVRPSSWRT